MARFSFIRRKPQARQDVVVGKIPKQEVCAAEVLLESRLAPELSCCWQEAQGPSRAGKPPPQNALDQKLSCCWQDRADASFGPECAFSLAILLYGGCVALAITPPVIRVSRTPLLKTVEAHLAAFGVGGYFLAVIIGAAAPLAARFAANRLPWLILRWLEDSFTVAATPFDHTGGCRTVRPGVKNLEAVLESVPPPRRWPFLNYKTGGNAAVLSRR
jgi:hypothetical protein